MDKNKNYMSYAFGKYSEAIYLLATCPGDIKLRLLAANDKFGAVDPEMLPSEIKTHIVWIQNQLLRFPSIGGEGKVRATIHRIHRSTCVKIAKRVVLVHSLLESELSSQRRQENSMKTECKFKYENNTG